MTKIFNEFILRFGHHHEIRKPLGNPPFDALKPLYEEFGTGWSANYLINILEPAFIPELNSKLLPLKSLIGKTLFAVSGLGVLFFICPNHEIEAFDPYSNTLTSFGSSLDTALNHNLFTNNYNPLLSFQLIKKLTSELGPLPVESIYQIDCLPLFIPLSSSSKYKISPLYSTLDEWVALLSSVENK